MTSIRPLVRGDVDFAMAQKAREGWQASREQFEIYLELDPDGCFLVLEDGRPVGMVTTTGFGSSGWIGNLIVEPAFRSRGIGRALMEHGIEHLRGRGAAAVRLEADPQGIPLYRSLGFVDEFESRRLKLAAAAGGASPGDAAAEPMAAAELDEVAALDAAICGADRRRFLELKRERSELAVVRRGRRGIDACLMAVATDRGLRIGPCVALDVAGARCLIDAAVAAAAGRAVMIGVPAPNAAALDLLAGMGFERRPSSLRMRLGPAVAVGDPQRVFAISSGATG